MNKACLPPVQVPLPDAVGTGAGCPAQRPTSPHWSGGAAQGAPVGGDCLEYIND
jgi:hypothetical protein